MHLKTIVATALLPLLAVADDTQTLTSTMTMTKYVTIARVATSSVYSNATATSFHPLGTGYSTVLPTTTAQQGSGSPTSSSPTVSPTIDNGGSSGAGSLSAFGFAGVAGMVLAALM